jgi:hypothetical protein
LCAAELRLRAGENRPVRTHHAASADGSLTMITCGRSERAQRLRLIGAGGGGWWTRLVCASWCANWGRWAGWWCSLRSELRSSSRLDGSFRRVGARSGRTEVVAQGVSRRPCTFPVPSSWPPRSSWWRGQGWHWRHRAATTQAPLRPSPRRGHFWAEAAAIIPGCGYWDAVRYGATETGVLESHVGAAAVAGRSVGRRCGGVRGD